MNEITNKLLSELEDQLKFIVIEQDGPIKYAAISIGICRKALEKF